MAGANPLHTAVYGNPGAKRRANGCRDHLGQTELTLCAVLETAKGLCVCVLQRSISGTEICARHPRWILPSWLFRLEESSTLPPYSWLSSGEKDRPAYFLIIGGWHRWCLHWRSWRNWPVKSDRLLAGRISGRYPREELAALDPHCETSK